MNHLPVDFVTRIREQFGAEGDALLESLDRPTTTSVRFNKLKAGHSALDIDDEVRWCSGAYFLKHRPSFTMDPFFHAGCYYPQESSSMFLYTVLNQIFDGKSPINGLDLCASPGGKTLLLSDFIGKRGKLIANEVNKTRNAILREVVQKWGCDNVVVTSSSAASYAIFKSAFNCVLIDAPCSGEGMFRKDLGARLEWSAENVQHCARTQQSILDDMMSTVADEGFLIYSTCTFSEDENLGSCRRIVNSGDFKPVIIDTSEFPEIEVVNDNGFTAYQFLPHRVRGEGFFIAVFEKINPSRSSTLKPKMVFSIPEKKEQAIIQSFAECDLNLAKDPAGNIWQSVFTVEQLNELASALYITAPGIEIGRIVRDEFIPAHGLAMSHLPVNCVYEEVDIEKAIAYLRGESIRISNRRGWVMLTYEGARIGWVKCVGERCNNYYPKEFRVRMKNPG